MEKAQCWNKHRTAQLEGINCAIGQSIAMAKAKNTKHAKGKDGGSLWSQQLNEALSEVHYCQIRVRQGKWTSFNPGRLQKHAQTCGHRSQHS